MLFLLFLQRTSTTTGVAGRIDVVFCLHKLAVDNDAVLRRAEHACQQAAAPLNPRQLNVAVRAVAAGVERGFVKNRGVLGHVHAVSLEVVAVCALGAGWFGKEGVIRVVVQGSGYS